MSNNNNGNNNQKQLTNVVAPNPIVEQREAESVTKTMIDPQKAAIQTCLRILLRAATMGSVARSHEEEIKLAIASLE